MEQFGVKAIESHNIVVGTPMAFQGDERDIMILLDSELGNSQQDAESKKKWNVAISRAKEKVYLVNSYRKNDLKAYDIRREILRFFTEASETSDLSTAHAGCTRRGNIHLLRQQAEPLLVTGLRKHGFVVSHNTDSNTWTKALRISLKGVVVDALVDIDNAGESDDTWDRTVKQQYSLEDANRICLRVPLVSLALDFQTNLGWILSSLRSAGQGVDLSRSMAIVAKAGSIQTKRSVQFLNHLAQMTVRNDPKKDAARIKRGRVFINSLHFKTHTNDLKIEFRHRGVAFLIIKTTFTNLKGLDEGSEESFLPRSDAEFLAKKN